MGRGAGCAAGRTGVHFYHPVVTAGCFLGPLSSRAALSWSNSGCRTPLTLPGSGGTAWLQFPGPGSERSSFQQAKDMGLEVGEWCPVCMCRCLLAFCSMGMSAGRRKPPEGYIAPQKLGL